MNADASVVSGTLTTPTTSVPVQNAVIAFNLSQAGVDVSHAYALTTTPVSCATDTTGAVKGMPDPLVSALATPVTAAGSLAGTYYVKIQYTDGTNHSNASPSLTVNVSGPNNTLTITAPTLHPFSATGYSVYIGTVSGSEKLQAAVTGFGGASITSYNASGTAISLTNTSTCSLIFNDAIIPPYTTYRVTATASNGVNISGFPQSWYLAGASVDIANLVNVTNINARFPSPILSNPLSAYATQSINSPLTLNGYALTAGSIIGQSGALAVTGNVTLTGNEYVSGNLGVGVTSANGKLHVKVATDQNAVIVAGSGLGGANGVGIASINDANNAYTNLVLAGSVVMLSANGVSKFVVDAAGHKGTINTAGTTSVASNGGTTALLTGSNDMAGEINQSASGATIITLTFGTTFGAVAHVCFASNFGAVVPVKIQTNATTATLTGTFANGDQVSYHCERYGS